MPFRVVVAERTEAPKVGGPHRGAVLHFGQPTHRRAQRAEGGGGGLGGVTGRELTFMAQRLVVESEGARRD